MLIVNPFVGKFQQAYEILSQSGSTNPAVHAHLRYNSATDRRRYNLPETDEIAVVLPGDGTVSTGKRDIIIHLKANNQLMQISEQHPFYLPLHYVLLFPYGELGWEDGLRRWDTVRHINSTAKLTQLNFYCYRIFHRPT